MSHRLGTAQKSQLTAKKDNFSPRGKKRVVKKLGDCQKKRQLAA
jgi:hypothetical protein